MNIVLFEDAAVSQLFPITLGKPAYAISCGGCRVVDLVEDLQVPVFGLVRQYLREVQDARYAVNTPANAIPDGPALWINARLVPSLRARQTLRRMSDGDRACVVLSGQHVAVARFSVRNSMRSSQLSPENVGAYFAKAMMEGLVADEVALPLFDYPHEVIAYHKENLAENLLHRIKAGTYHEIADGVFAAGGATLGEYVVSDTSAGPIVLEEGATIGPYSYLRGPVYLGREATILPHACVKDHVSIGQKTKVGGEVAASIVETCSNKQHHGYLGHSYVGSWVNLGAGTSNSDLKNTYGEVRMQYGEKKVATGSQFMGCVVGDYVKSAINTSIFTGKTIGTCSMLYGFVTTNVPSFVNYARWFGQITEIPPPVAISAQERVYLRRNEVHRPCDAQLVRDMFELTRSERQAADFEIGTGVPEL